MKTISAAGYLIFTTLFFTACGSSEADEHAQDSLAADSVEQLHPPLSDSLTKGDSEVQTQTPSGAETFDSATIMQTIGILDSIKALKKK